MCVTVTSRITVSITLVVITTMKERRVVAILILHSNVTSVDICILIRHWMESATTIILVAFTFALMSRERFKTVCGSQAVMCRHFFLKWSKIVINRTRTWSQ